MSDDQRGCVERERACDDFPWIDSGLADRALKEQFRSDQPVLTVEEKTDEVFPWLVPEPQAKKSADLIG